MKKKQSIAQENKKIFQICFKTLHIKSIKFHRIISYHRSLRSDALLVANLEHKSTEGQ